MVVLESDEVLQRGDTAPEFELEGTDGETYTPEDFAEDHSVLLVVFTCNHCPYAQAKIGTLNDIADDYEEVAVVGVNPNDEEEYPEDSFEEMVAAVEDGEVDYTAYLRDDLQEAAAAYGARCTPDPFLFGRKDGEWVLAYHGRLTDATNPDEEPTEHYGREAIDTILSGGTVDMEYRPARGCSIKWREGNEPDYVE
ncbi:thioredoxin family protein [Halobacteriales archaeon QS_8_69_26]|nr:MAG: thioredoxin family protein [Halobacteriales archaeon QS_8_69_26]